jgi:hypothetical protein
MAQGKLQEALEAYQQELKVDKKLASQDPTNAVWQNAAAWSRYCKYSARWAASCNLQTPGVVQAEVGACNK